MDIQIQSRNEAIIDGVIVKDEVRLIFKHNGFIYKVDSYDDIEDCRNESFKTQCQIEVEFWNDIEDQDKKYFQPIVAHGDYWVAQELIAYPDRRDSENWPIIEGLADKYELDDIYEDKNWGTREDGSPVIYDYGV